MKSAILCDCDLVSILLLIILATFLGTDFFSPVRFDQEKIEVWAVDGQIQVRGLYHYQNRTILPLSFSLGLPFPVDQEHPAPSTFCVTEAKSTGETWDAIRVRTYHANRVFRVFFWPKQAKWIQVDYVQTAYAERGRYILKTTRKWNRPLNHGEYILHLGNGLKLASSTYPLKHDSPDIENTYSFSRVDFYPREDWRFVWHRTGSMNTTRMEHQ
jgi:hypothetical protein